MGDTTRLGAFVGEMTRSIAVDGGNEARMLDRTRELLADLVSVDDWLPDDCAVPDPDTYRQYLLHCDPLERFSVVSFVWGPGQQTPVHNHRTWGVIGLLRGGESDTHFTVGDGTIEAGDQTDLHPGDLGMVSPTIGDVHQVANPYDDQTSISIHVYGANIGRVSREVFDPADGTPSSFISAYSNATVPNLWN